MQKKNAEQSATNPITELLSQMEALEYDANRLKRRAVEEHDRDTVLQMRAKLDAFREVRAMAAAVRERLEKQ